MWIESEHNQKIKQLLKLQSKSKERKSTNSFVVEGLQENRLALQAGYKPIAFYICPNIYDGSLDKLISEPVYQLSDLLYSKLAYRKTTEGILGVYTDKNDYLLPSTILENSTFVVLEAVEKPGNLGAILRSCDATACSGIVLIDSLVDFFNPNVIRSSVGTVFTNSLYKTNFEDFAHWISAHKIGFYATHLNQKSKDLFSVNYSSNSAFLFGTENSGISDRFLTLAKEIVKIPMLGKVDSLNVSNSVAVCLYERLRQQKLNLQKPL